MLRMLNPKGTLHRSVTAHESQRGTCALSKALTCGWTGIHRRILPMRAHRPSPTAVVGTAARTVVDVGGTVALAASGGDIASTWFMSAKERGR